MTRIGAATTGCQNQKFGDKLGRSEIFRTRRARVTQLERASAYFNADRIPKLVTIKKCIRSIRPERYGSGFCGRYVLNC